MKEKTTSAPAKHQVPGAKFKKCMDCHYWIVNSVHYGGVGICRKKVERTVTDPDGFIHGILPYPGQVACEHFRQNRKLEKDTH